MSDESLNSCVLIPCSQSEAWAVPQICLAEILTLQTAADIPPDEVEWRGQTVPVLDLGKEDDTSWQEHRGVGMVAIFLGLKGEGCEYWGIAVRGDGLSVVKVSADEVTDAPDDVLPHATAAFRLNDVLYQVPDLDSFQKQISAEMSAALSGVEVS